MSYEVKHAVNEQPIEQRLELTLRGAEFCLLELGFAFWEETLSRIGIKILSLISNRSLQAYLLSESSLLVYADRLVAITCGELLSEELCADIKALLPEQCLLERTRQVRFSDRGVVGDPLDQSVSWLLLEGLSERWIRCFQGLDSENILSELKFLLPQFATDDHYFEPVGYSLNGIRGSDYITLHASPDVGQGIVSIELMISSADRAAQLGAELVELIRPKKHLLRSGLHLNEVLI